MALGFTCMFILMKKTVLLRFLITAATRHISGEEDNGGQHYLSPDNGEQVNTFFNILCAAFTCTVPKSAKRYC